MANAALTAAAEKAAAFEDSPDGHMELFRRYLRIRSVHPRPDYDSCVQLLQAYATDALRLPSEVIECAPGCPAVLITWKGEQPELPALLLNSHSDVVPVDEACWQWDPWAADMDADGNIYARGTQDMKCVTIQHLVAVRHLRAQHEKLKRTVYILVVPEEEMGGLKGMAKLIEMDRFKQLNIGLALDEGLANPKDQYTVFYGERAPWFVDIIATGAAGHGSRFIEPSAVNRLLRVLNKCLEFRDSQARMLREAEASCGKTLGDFTSLNITMLEAGSQHNVVPVEAKAGLDIRIPPHVDLDEFRLRLDEWTAGEGVSYSFFVHTKENKSSSTDSDWWIAAARILDEIGVGVDLQVFPAATDSRYLRLLNIPAFGFSPMRKTPILLHDHNEMLNRGVFLEGIPVFERLIAGLAAL